jgi:hypothetical protein
MSTGTSARRVRSALAVHSVLLGFIAIYVSIVVLSFAIVRTLEPRLPVEARNLASYWLESELIVIAMYLVWIALPRQHRMRYALRDAAAHRPRCARSGCLRAGGEPVVQPR